MFESIEFAAGFMGPHRDDGVFHTYDEKQAKRKVRAEAKRSPDLVEVYVGLDGDWNCNNDLLWKDGQYYEPEFWTSSLWAKPSLLFVYADGKEKNGGTCYTDKPKEDA